MTTENEKHTFKIKPIKGNRKQWDNDQYKAVYMVYMSFLKNQRDGTAYQKAASVRELATKLERSKGSIECLMMNISAIHRDLLKLDYVTGYKPLENYSGKLANYVCTYNGFEYSVK